MHCPSLPTLRAWRHRLAAACLVPAALVCAAGAPIRAAQTPPPGQETPPSTPPAPPHTPDPAQAAGQPPTAVTPGTPAATQTPASPPPQQSPQSPQSPQVAAGENKKTGPRTPSTASAQQQERNRDRNQNTGTAGGRGNGISSPDAPERATSVSAQMRDMRAQLYDTQQRLRIAEQRLEAAQTLLRRATQPPDGDPQTLFITAIAVSALSALLWVANVVYLIRCGRWSRRVGQELPGMVAVEVDRKLAAGPGPTIPQAQHVMGTAPASSSPLPPLWSTPKMPGDATSAAAAAARLSQRLQEDSSVDAEARDGRQIRQGTVLSDAVKHRGPATDRPSAPAPADTGGAYDQWDDDGSATPAAAPVRERTGRPQENGQPDRYVFYAQTPDANGSFPASTLSRQPDAWTLFEIQGGGPVVAGARAVLRISDELKAQASAIASHRQFLLPVCDYGGVIPSANARRINLLKLGHVEFDGERWTVQVKARIEFLE